MHNDSSEAGDKEAHNLFSHIRNIIIIIIIDNFCIALFSGVPKLTALFSGVPKLTALFSGVPKLTALYILQHFLSFTNIIHIIMTTSNV